MCELLGLSFESAVAADFSVSAFATRDVENGDGWGLAWYSGRSLTVVKEPVSWRQSAYSQFLEAYENLRSPIYLAHVRHATVGGKPKHADTHPFSRELFGRMFCFAHNGTVRGAHEKLRLGRFWPVGGTDSEHVFCHLLDALAERGTRLRSEADWRWLYRRFQVFNSMGKFNCLMSDGERLFVYHDKDGFKGLTIRKVCIHPNRPRELNDPTFGVRLDDNEDNCGIVIATRPLSERGWHSLEPGELLVIERGSVAHSSNRPSWRPRIETAPPPPEEPAVDDEESATHTGSRLLHRASEVGGVN